MTARTEDAVEAARRLIRWYGDMRNLADPEIDALTVARALLSAVERERKMKDALTEIKRCNAQYNFGSKLLRIVNAALPPQGETT